MVVNLHSKGNGKDSRVLIRRRSPRGPNSDSPVQMAPPFMDGFEVSGQGPQGLGRVCDGSGSRSGQHAVSGDDRRAHHRAFHTFLTAWIDEMISIDPS